MDRNGIVVNHSLNNRMECCIILYLYIKKTVLHSWLMMQKKLSEVRGMNECNYDMGSVVMKS